MLEQGLLKKNFVGRDGFFWWLGQVVDSKKWKDNSPGLPAGDLPGMKRRVKVRIMGYHTAQVEELTDDDLPWAYCMMPVTAGGNQGGMSQSVNFSGGEWVFGFFLDGEDGQQPVVMGVLDKSSQLTYPKEIPDVGFKPFSGFTNGLVESQHNIKKDGAPGESDPTQPDVQQGTGGVKTKPTLATEGAQLESVRQDIPDHGTKAAHENAKNTGKVKTAQSCADDNPQAGIQLAIQRVQAQVAFIQSQESLFVDPLSQKLGNISAEVERASQAVSAYMKDIMDKVRGVALQSMSEAMAKLSVKLPIDGMAKDFKKAMDGALEGLGCLFENIIGGLVDQMGGLLQDMLGRVTGALDCLVDNVIGGILDSAMGAINSVTDGITGAIDGVMGAVSGAVSGVTGALDSVLGAVSLPLAAAQNFLASLKALFTCQSETECQDIAQGDMLSGNAPEAPGDFLGMIGGALGGGGNLPEPIGGLMDAGKNVLDSVTGAVDSVTGAAEGLVGTAKNAFDTVSGIPGQALAQLEACNPFAELNSPPVATVFGGGTTPTEVNVITNSKGKVIAVDIEGSDIENRTFTSVPSVSVRGKTGRKGGGAGLQVIMEPPGFLNGGGNGGGTPPSFPNGGGNGGGTPPSFPNGGGNGGGTPPSSRNGGGTPPSSRNGGGTPPSSPNGGGGPRFGFDNLKTNPRPIQKIIVLETGKDFLPAPDGSIGGPYGTFAEKDDTVTRTPDGDFQKFIPGRDITVPPGTIVYPPLGSSLVFPDGTEDEDGNPADGFMPSRGLTIGNGFFIPEEFSFRTPVPEPAELDVATELGGATFPVILELDDIAVRKTGVSFNNGDTITISGDDNEITLEPILSTNGSILGVRIPEDQRGQGFTDVPDLTINTQTGAGALLTPLLRVKYRGQDNIDDVIESVTDDQIIKVVNCVGAKPDGYLNGKPYYGPYHLHNGRKMVGAEHTSEPHGYIEDTPDQRSQRSTSTQRRVPRYSSSGGAGGGAPIGDTGLSRAGYSPMPTPSPSPTPTPTPTPSPTPSPSPSPSPGSPGYGGGY